MLIRESVGRGGRNPRGDVLTVQQLLNRHVRPPARPSAESGVADVATIEAIVLFQRRVVRMRRPDGRVDPGGRTIRALADDPSQPGAVETQTGYEMLTDQSVARPSYALMLQAYGAYVRDSAPCKNPRIHNQCAVRMSVAMGRCGVGLDAFQPQDRVHQGRRVCSLSLPHVVGAHELARHLASLWGAPRIFRGRSLGQARDQVRNQRGVIYFNNCFRREKGGPQVGDHIDLWDGSRYYNLVIRVGAGGNAGVRTPLFERADQVWHWRL